MKKILIPIGALLLSGLSHAQLSPTENYVYSKTYLTDPTVSNPKVTETVQYFDGLGRPKQVVNVKASPLGKDVVTHIEYDGFGRQVKDYLPVPQSGTLNGAIVPNPLSNATQPGIYGSEKIYAEKILENSPLDRIQQQIQVGNDWSGKPVKFEYDANSINDRVGNFITATIWVDNATKTVARTSDNFFYQTSQLYKNTVIDEDGNKTIEFKNGRGQTLLIRKVISATENADTYYIYNEYDQLAFIIPPKASLEFLDGAGSDDEIPESILNNLCYQYKYDGRNRLVEKKLPGKGWEYMVYDKADRLIFTQDANMRTSGKWLITKYDQFGRTLYTGIILAGTRDNLQGTANNFVVTESKDSTGSTKNGMQVYYTNTLFNQIETLLSVNYYDTYPAGSPTIPAAILNQPVLTQDSQNSNISTKSLPTASYVKNIENDNWTKNYTWYDNKARPIGTHSINHLGGYTKTETQLDFSGTPQLAITRHKRLNSDTERVVTETFTYDHQNRLSTHKHKVDNNSEEILAQNEYNELSQLESKKVGGTVLGSGLQTVDYVYNIRGWMTNINDANNLGTDLFGYKINYNLVEGLENPNTDFMDLKVKPKYNGNIAEVSWKTLTEDNEPLKRYGYVYDPLNRLSAGFYQKAGSEAAREYFEKMDYDLNGNITRLKRSEGVLNGSTTALIIDNLKYDYTGNRLVKVSDEQQNPSGYPYLSVHNTIGYDENGNMTSHLDKGISSIVYNYLNLPINITSGLGKFQNQIYYAYKADGTKSKKVISSAFSTFNREVEYLDGFQYDSIIEFCIGCPSQSVNLKFVPTSEGYFDFEKNLYIYNYTDHLGNVRLSYADTSRDGVVQPRDMTVKHCEDLGDGNIACSSVWVPGEIVEVNNYYPFGLLHNYVNTTQNSYQYKYNGKELQETGMYDYGARFYMPDIGRWGVVDPLAETSRRWSTYTYAYNNPINFIDPDGREGLGWGLKDNVWSWDANLTAQNYQEQGFSDYKEDGSVISNSPIQGQEGGDTGQTYLGFNGQASYIPADGNGSAGMLGLSNWFRDALASITPSFGGSEEFPQLTDPGGMARNDFDASSWDKFRPGDKLFTLDIGNIPIPGNASTLRLPNIAEIFKNLESIGFTDAPDWYNKNDSVYIGEMLTYPSLHDTIKKVPVTIELIHRQNFRNKVDSVNSAKGNEWHKKTFGW